MFRILVLLNVVAYYDTMDWFYDSPVKKVPVLLVPLALRGDGGDVVDDDSLLSDDDEKWAAQRNAEQHDDDFSYISDDFDDMVRGGRSASESESRGRLDLLLKAIEQTSR